MPEYATEKALYHDAKREKVFAVAPDEAVPSEAAFLIAAAGTRVAAADVQHYGLTSHVKAPEEVDLLKAHKELLKAAVERGALEEAAALQQAIARLEVGGQAAAHAMSAPERVTVTAPANPAGSGEPANPAAQPLSGKAGERSASGGAPSRAAAQAEEKK